MMYKFSQIKLLSLKSSSIAIISITTLVQTSFKDFANFLDIFNLTSNNSIYNLEKLVGLKFFFGSPKILIRSTKS